MGINDRVPICAICSGIAETVDSSTTASTVDICSLVLTDIETRRAVGMERYGVPLTPNNGKDALMESYEEALDLIIYLRQYIYEQRGN
jgi:hypothetical protein